MIQEVIRNFYGGASLELCCPKCKKIEYGTEPELYLVAKEIVNDMKFSYYDDLEESEQVYQMNIAKVAEIISWGFVNLGYCDENGFRYPLIIPDALLHEELNLKRDKWQAYKEVHDNDDTD